MVQEIGRTQFTWRDCLLIGVVWSPVVVLPWIKEWQELVLPLYIAQKKTVNREDTELMKNLKVSFMCFMAIFMAFVSDLLNRHYLIWCICIELYTGVQIYGIVIYYTGPYEAADIVWWFSSVIFWGSAVQPCIIFSQNQNAYRFHSHLVLAACELFYVLGKYLLFWVVGPYQSRTALEPIGYSQILPWATTVALVCIIIAARVLKKHSAVAKPERPPIKVHAKHIWMGIKKDSKSMQAVKFALFASFVVPMWIPLALHYGTNRLDLNSDGSSAFIPAVEHLYLLGRFFGLIIIEAVLFGIRRLNKRLSDILSLGIPLILYLFVAIALYYQLLALRPVQKAATKSLEEEIEHAPIFVGPIPSKTQAVIDFYNVMNDTIEIVSPGFILEAPLIPYSRAAVGLNKTANIPIKVIIDDESMRGNGTERSQCFCVISKLDRIHSFIIHGNSANIDIFKIFDHGKIKPSVEPAVIVMNSFMDPREDQHRVLMLEEMYQKELSYFESHPSFAPDTSIVSHVPVGGIKFIYENLEEITDFRNPDDTSTNIIVTEKFVVYTILITLQEGRGYMASYEIMRVNVNTARTNIPKIQEFPTVTLALVVMGAAYSSLVVAFYHHFWMDSPLRLRATLVAICLVSHKVTKRVVHATLYQMEHWQALAMVILMGALVTSHFITASLYFYHFKFGYRPDEKDDKSERARNNWNRIRNILMPTPTPSGAPIQKHPTQKAAFNGSSQPIAPIGS